MGEFSKFMLRDGEGRWFLSLKRIDVHVSDVRNMKMQFEGHYDHWFRLVIESRTASIEIPFLGVGMLHIYLAPKKVNCYVELYEDPFEDLETED